jgi:hypothetical protein
MTPPLDDALRTRLRARAPQRVCALDPAAEALARQCLGAGQVTTWQPESPLLCPQPCPLALGVTLLDGLDARQAMHVLNRVRTYVAPALLIVTPPGCPLDAPAFLALGFSLLAEDPAGQGRLHEFDLETYKTVPDWLNARFWAHPERWEP